MISRLTMSQDVCSVVVGGIFIQYIYIYIRMYILNI